MLITLLRMFKDKMRQIGVLSLVNLSDVPLDSQILPFFREKKVLQKSKYYTRGINEPGSNVKYFKIQLLIEKTPVNNEEIIFNNNTYRIILFLHPIPKKLKQYWNAFNVSANYSYHIGKVEDTDGKRIMFLYKHKDIRNIFRIKKWRYFVDYQDFILPLSEQNRLLKTDDEVSINFFNNKFRVILRKK